ncbi:MAG: ISKra4 family transposase, partial [Microcoleaceae cyanobacterium]
MKTTQDPFANATQHYQNLIKELSSVESQHCEHGKVEEYLQIEGRELLRRLLQGYLDLRASQEIAQQEVVGADQEKRPHKRKQCQRKLESVFGEVKVTRMGYSTKKEGVSALYPEDGKLNLSVDQYSDEVRKRVAVEAAKVSFSETSQTIAETTGARVGKRQCEELCVKVARDFEEIYSQREQTAEESTQDLLVLTTDGKGIVMHQADLREATAKAAEQKKTQSKTRLSPGEKRQRKRMATVASVYSTARYHRSAPDIIGEDKLPPQRPAISNKRVWASVRHEAESVIHSVFEEANRRDPQHQREWVGLVDGGEHQLQVFKTTAKQTGVELTIVLDFIHVLEYLWKAAFCFHPVGSEEAEVWVRERALRLLEGKASDVAAGIRRSATLNS